ncbi:MAG: GFA family protein [Paracoccaceae bacterium]
MSKSGGCLCGAVRFEITSEVTETGACHCGMCRKVSGGVFLGVEVPAEAFAFTSDNKGAVYSSSTWAERGFCSACGSSLYYRVTAPGPHQGTWHVGLGSLDDPNDVTLTGEIFIDLKPSGYAFAGDTHKMTEAQVMEMFGPS